jgi:hypothetical protein
LPLNDQLISNFHNDQVRQFGQVLVPSQLPGTNYTPPALNAAQQRMADHYTKLGGNATKDSMMMAATPAYY